LIPNLDMSMPARGGLLPGVAMSSPFKGSTTAYTAVRMAAVRLKGRNSHPVLGDHLFKDARPSPGDTQHQFHDIADSQPNTNHASRAVGLSDLTIYCQKETHVRVSHPLACYWVRASVDDPLLLTIDTCCRAGVDLDVSYIAVIGWRSAGKSSLIEAIFGITLPRASSTCAQ
jgi:hypothetical protein